MYVSVLLGILRKYQRDEKVPDFEEFCKEVLASCESPSQAAPLQQRLDLLKQFVSEAKVNKDIRKYQKDLKDLVKSGTLVIADLTDPMLSPRDADGIFQVLLQQFRQIDISCGKLVVCDEAHKYFDENGTYGLAKSCVEAVRLMRHEGLRIVVSTQSPMTMPPELLELSTTTVLHRFHSEGWWKYLSSKIPLPKNGFQRVKSLKPGQALVFAPNLQLSMPSTQQSISDIFNGVFRTDSREESSGDVFECHIRQRITKDKGRSKNNKRTRKKN